MARKSAGSAVNVVMITLIGFVTLYPFIYILSTSITPAEALLAGKIVLWPRGFDLSAYRLVLTDKRLMSGFVNTVQYTLVGTAISLFLTTLTAFPLAQPKFQRYASVYMKLVVFTMLFSGGLIPTYLTIRTLGLVNTFWVMVIPGAVSPFYLILVRTFMQQLPHELSEAALIDGANDFQLFSRIYLPLCTPIIACISLYYAVGIWNSYMTPLIYLSSEKLYPLQIYLRQIVLMSAMQEQMMMGQGGTESLTNTHFNSESMKAATLVISTVPILIVYPFLQRYFVKGIMVGAVKG